MASEKRAVWVADLEVKNVVAGLQQILDAFQKVTTAFGTELVVQLNVTQFNNLIETLEVGFKKLANSFGTDMANSSLAVIAHLERLVPETTKVAERMRANLADGLKSGAKTGVAAVVDEVQKGAATAGTTLDKLSDRLASIVAKTGYASGRMTDAGRQALQDKLAAEGIDVSSGEGALSLTRPEGKKLVVSSERMAQLSESMTQGKEQSRAEVASKEAEAAASRLVAKAYADEAIAALELDNAKSKGVAKGYGQAEVAARESAIVASRGVAQAYAAEVVATLELDAAKSKGVAKGYGQEAILAKDAEILASRGIAQAYANEVIATLELEAAKAKGVAKGYGQEATGAKSAEVLASRGVAQAYANEAIATLELDAAKSKGVAKGYGQEAVTDKKAEAAASRGVASAYAAEERATLDLNAAKAKGVAKGYGITAEKDKKAEQDWHKGVAKAYADQYKAVDAQDKAHKRVGTSLLGNIGSALKLFLLYRALRDTIREVEAAFGDFVKAGIDYVKQQEENKNNLTGVLAANFKIVDLQGQTVTGEERINVLKDKARILSEDILTATKGTSIETKDLVQAYETLAAPLVKYKLNTKEILELSLQTVAAGKAVGVNAKEAATQLDQILSGKGAESKMAHALQLSPTDIRMLQGTAEGLALIKTRLTELGSGNIEVGDTVEALALQFKKVIGPLSAAIEIPFFTAFKDFVRTATAYMESPAGKDLFAQINAAGKGIASTLVSEANDIAGAGANIAGIIAGAGKAIELVIRLAGGIVWLVKVMLEIIATFTTVANSIGATNIEVALGIAAFYKFGTMVQTAAAAGGALAKVLTMLIPVTTTATAAVAATTTSVSALTTVMTTLASASVVGVVLVALGLVADKLTHMWTQARLAKEAMQGVLSGNLDAATQARTQQFGAARNPTERAEASYGLVTIADDRASELWKTKTDLAKKYGIEVGDVASIVARLAETEKTSSKGYDEEHDKSSVNATNLKDKIIDIRADQALLRKGLGDAVQSAESASTAVGSVNREIIEAQKALPKSIKQAQDSASLFPSEFSAGGVSPIVDLKTKDLAEVNGLARRVSDDTIKAIGLTKELKKEQDKLSFEDERRYGVVPAPVGSEPPEGQPTRFHDDSDAQIKKLRTAAELANSADKVAVAQRLKTEDDYAEGVIKREMALNVAIEEILTTRIEKFTAFAARRIAMGKFDAQKNPQGYKPDEVDSKDPATGETIQGSLSVTATGYQADKEAGLKAAKLLQDQLVVTQENRKHTFALMLEEYELQLDAIESGITGQVADKAEAELLKKLKRLEESQPNTADGRTAKGTAIAHTMQLLPQVRQDAAERKALKDQVQTTADVTRQQNLLNAQLANGSVSTREFAVETIRLRDALRASLEAQKATLNQKAGHTTDTGELGRIAAEIDTIDARLAGIKTHAQDVQKAFFDWLGVFEQIGQSFHVFDVFGEKIGRVGDGFAEAVSQAKMFYDIIKQGQGAFTATMTAMASGTQGNSTQTFGGSIGASTVSGAVQGVDSKGKDAGLATLEANIMPLASSFSVLTKSSGGMVEGFSGFLNKLGGGSGKGGGGVSTVIGAMGVAGMAAGVVIGIASAMFAAAVKRATDTMDKQLVTINAAISDGVQATNESYRQLEALRVKSIADYSGSKAGRKALDAEMPKILSAMQNLQKAAQGTIDAMMKTFNIADLGHGPEADFAKILIDLGEQSKKYLAALLTVNDQQGHLITQTSAEYINGVAAMDKLYRKTVEDELTSLTSQDQGNAAEDIAALQKVVQLTDQKLALEKQVADLNDQERQLGEDIADLANDRADEAKKQADDRLAAVKKILDLEQQIRDLELETANTIADIKQRGVLEAQSTVAEQKARDISAVRSAAAIKLAKLQGDLADANDTTKLQKDQAKANIDLDKRTAALEKQRQALHDQGMQLMQQIQLNNIDLGIAQSIADIENAIFHFSADRYDLEKQSGAIQIDQANLKVKQWREVEALIRAIDLNGADLFVPPPGFPVINVVIGDITIDNTDNSHNTQNNTGQQTGGAGLPRSPDPLEPVDRDPGGYRSGQDNSYYYGQGGYPAQ